MSTPTDTPTPRTEDAWKGIKFEHLTQPEALAVLLRPFRESQRLERELAAVTQERDELKAKNEDLAEDLNWQNRRNSNRPTRGGFEFYINEEWTCIADMAMDTDCGGAATLMKNRYDPDDERVRVRRVIEDDEILKDLAASQSRELALREAHESFRDTVLHERHGFAEENIPVNLILSELDASFEAALSAPPPPVVRKEVAEKLADALVEAERYTPVGSCFERRSREALAAFIGSI